ncbi:MAG: hypothetical protein E6R13_02640 [Spirochaetes bacterium]|nr:MAG: hypothetical protein E6R13_02640 [Spirochaetota bacterium]
MKIFSWQQKEFPNLYDDKVVFYRNLVKRKRGEYLFNKDFLILLSSAGRNFPEEVDFLFKLLKEGEISTSYINGLFYLGIDNNIVSTTQELSSEFKGFKL